jgi:hypothetical protein
MKDQELIIWALLNGWKCTKHSYRVVIKWWTWHKPKSKRKWNVCGPHTIPSINDDIRKHILKHIEIVTVT